MMKKVIIYLLLSVLIALPASAFAYSLSLDDDYYVDVVFNESGAVYLSYVSGQDVDGNDIWKNSKIATGVFDLNFYASKDDSNGSPLYTTQSFCVEIAVIYGSDYASLNKITDDDLLLASWLLDTYWQSDMSSDEIAGLQLAIWEIISSGQLTAISADSLAQMGITEDKYTYYSYYLTYISAAEKADLSNYSTDNLIVKFDKNQDMMTTPVPEPATMLLLGAGLLGLAGIGSKRKRTAGKH